MVEQVIGTATVAVLVLTYFLILQTLTAAVLLLGQFIVVQVRALRVLVAVEWQRPEPAPVSVADDQRESYRVGGGLLRW
jgi:phage portal protein BeeE